jgi:hypothetical protein
MRFFKVAVTATYLPKARRGVATGQFTTRMTAGIVALMV